MKPPLSNPRHERFAQGIVRGLTVGQAYAEAGYRRNDSNCSRLRSKPFIKRRVKEIQEENNEMSLISRQASLAFLTKIALTPVGEVTQASPLCQEYIESTTEHGASLRVKMPNKIQALQLIGKWCGWETGNQAEQEAAKALGGIAEMMARIRAGGAAARRGNAA